MSHAAVDLALCLNVSGTTLYLIPWAMAVRQLFGLPNM